MPSDPLVQLLPSKWDNRPLWGGGIKGQQLLAGKYSSSQAPQSFFATVVSASLFLDKCFYADSVWPPSSQEQKWEAAMQESLKELFLAHILILSSTDGEIQTLRAARPRGLCLGQNVSGK